MIEVTTVIGSVTAICVAVFASQGFWDWMKTKRKKKTPQDLMLLAIGRDLLLQRSKTYDKCGFIPEDEYESFKSLGDAYVGMGGNSLVKKRYNQAKELPVKDE